MKAYSLKELEEQREIRNILGVENPYLEPLA